MNVFHLSDDPKQAAKWHVDDHVVKMILESAQIISTAAKLNGLQHSKLYNKTHVNHPVVLWCSRSQAHLKYVYNLAKYLNDEFKYRYDNEQDHKSWAMLSSVGIDQLAKVFPDNDAEKQPLAMPEKFHTDDVVKSYKLYYIDGKSHLHSWTKRSKPPWLKDLKQKNIKQLQKS